MENSPKSMLFSPVDTGEVVCCTELAVLHINPVVLLSLCLHIIILHIKDIFINDVIIKDIIKLSSFV